VGGCAPHLCCAQDDFGRMFFGKKISFRFHIFITECPMLAAKRGAGTTVDRYGMRARKRKISRIMMSHDDGTKLELSSARCQQGADYPNGLRPRAG